MAEAFQLAAVERFDTKLTLALFEGLVPEYLFARLLIVEFPSHPCFEAFSPESFVIDGVLVPAHAAGPELRNSIHRASAFVGTDDP